MDKGGNKMPEITEEYILQKGFKKHNTIYIKGRMLIYKSSGEWRFACGSRNVIIENTTELGQIIYYHEVHNCNRHTDGSNPSDGLDI